LPLLEIDHDLLQAADSKDLANGYQLVKQGQLGNLEIFNNDRFKREFGETVLVQAHSANLYVRVSEEIASRTDFETAVTRSNEKIDRLLLALNVNEKLWNFSRDIRFSWLQDESRGQITIRHDPPRSTVEDNPEFENFSEAAELTVTIDAVYSGEPESRYAPVRTAFDALRLGLYAFNVSMRFLQEAIALEALCSASDTEVTHRVAMTCAILIGTEPEQRKMLYKEAKRLYGIRSRIIHGSGKRATIQDLKDIEQFTRQILRRILANDILPNYETTLKQREFLLRLSLEKDTT